MMGVLFRAPVEVGSWSWDIDFQGWPGVGDLLACLNETVPVLEGEELLRVSVISVRWREKGGGEGVKITYPVGSVVNESGALEPFHIELPSGLSDPMVSTIDLIGNGVWFDEDGERHEADQLVVVFVTSVPGAIGFELQVHHDIWSTYAFDGTPHPTIREKNAPRLARAIEGIEEVFRIEAEPGEPTYFGTSDRYGVRDPQPEEIFDGRGPDKTDQF
ncbi:hypothetical protein [Nocardiopsis tropica]|uniref:Uncharacterized protein n=1 Tax=Nocardiopsis tropica TaxID=109330 RepID=A0ABU7KYN7_9ACTN|nr:hypothetical protein [Nocardiopsis umidischolae]MEE2054380.1 hypothetical protein [Nocardiopsis umidischolae]